MKLTIEMTFDSYSNLVKKCDRSAPEYPILMAACINPFPKGDRVEFVIEIRCDMDQAQQLLEWAGRVYPEAAQEIIRALDLFRER